MVNALIGSSGFVGTTLQKQTSFDALFRSHNISEIHGRHFDLVVCAAAPAQKWIANKHPAEDRNNIERLQSSLSKMRCRKFILISTVDVFKSSVGTDEDSSADDATNGPYGLNRRELERFVQSNFSDHLIVRLPGLVGPGLRKNVIYDFLNRKDLEAIDSRGIFQFYPMTNLWYDIQIALENKLQLVHLTAEPIQVGDLSAEGFGRHFDQPKANAPASYDMQTKYAALFGGSGLYQYSRRETVQAVRAYAQSEALALIEEKV